MAEYHKTIWSNGTSPAINAANLNNIENGIENAFTEIAALQASSSSSEEITAAKNAILSVLGTPDTTVSGDIASVTSDVLAQLNEDYNSLLVTENSIKALIGPPTSVLGLAGDVADKSTQIMNKLGSSNSTIENQILSAKDSLLTVIGLNDQTLQPGQALKDLIGNVKNKLGTVNASTIEDQIEIAERNVLNKIGINLSDQKYTVKKWFESIEENISDLSDQLTEAEADLGRQIEDNRVEFEGRYQQLSDKMDALRHDLLTAFKSVADEAAIGDSNFAGNISIVPQATLLETVFAGNITQGG